jgi:hypothetical protein
MDHMAALRLMNDRLGQTLQAMIADLDDAQMAYAAPVVDTRPIGALAAFAYSRLLGASYVAAGRAWPDEAPPPHSTAAALTLIVELRSEVDLLLAALPAESLAGQITLPDGGHAARVDALVDGLRHGFLHAGRLAGIRAIGGFPVLPDAL